MDHHSIWLGGLFYFGMRFFLGDVATKKRSLRFLIQYMNPSGGKHTEFQYWIPMFFSNGDN